jgi:hypothetical protein
LPPFKEIPWAFWKAQVSLIILTVVDLLTKGAIKGNDNPFNNPVLVPVVLVVLMNIMIPEDGWN